MNRYHWLRSAGLGLVVLLSFRVVAGGVERPTKQRINVILLVLDQLRADRLHCYGNVRHTSPNIDGLAQRGVRFARFYSVAPWTAPSYATLMTSLYPSRHGITLFWRPGVPLIDEKIPRLAEVFGAHGYATAAFVNNGVAGRQLTSRGFAEYYEPQQRSNAVNITQRTNQPKDYSAPGTIPRVATWLDQHQQQPFFLFVLLFEPHSPYDPPPEHDLFKSDAYPEETDTGYDLKKGHLKRLAMLGDSKAIERLYQLYDGKIHFVDFYVGQLYAHLQKLGLDKNTVIALTSDHGELLYSHPRDYQTFDHRSLYDTNLHVPLILAGPNLPQGRVIDVLASNLDSAPTLLDLAGLPPFPGAQGQTLVPLLQGQVRAVNRHVFAEEDTGVPSRSVRTKRFKLILNLWTNQKQLFDLTHDPKELQDVARQNPVVTRELEAQLAEWMRHNQPSREEQRRRYRAYAHFGIDMLVDDQTTGVGLQLNGQGWHSDENPDDGHWAGGCFWIEPGDGSKTAAWRSDNPLFGTFKIFAYHGKLPTHKLATNAPFTVVTETGSKTIRVDFNQGAGQWNLLGTFTDPRYVSLRNAADGVILVDAVKFEQLE